MYILQCNSPRILQDLNDISVLDFHIQFVDVLEDVGLSEQNWVLWPHAPGQLPELPELPFAIIKKWRFPIPGVLFFWGGRVGGYIIWLEVICKDDYLFSYQSWKSLVRGMVMNGHPSMNMYL